MRFRQELSSAAACAATAFDGVLRDDYPPRVTSFGPVAQRQSSALIRRRSVDRPHLGPPVQGRAARAVRGRLGSSRSRCASAAQVRVLCSPPISCSPVRLTARTRPFQRRNTGSIPVRDATRGCSSRVEQPAFNRCHAGSLNAKRWTRQRRGPKAERSDQSCHPCQASAP